jgi:hypothetical protein
MVIAVCSISFIMFTLRFHNECDVGLPSLIEAAMFKVSKCSRFEILTPVTVRVTLLWDVPLCSLVDSYQRFEDLLPLSSEQRILKTEAVIYAKTCLLAIGLQGMLSYTAPFFLFRVVTIQIQ